MPDLAPLDLNAVLPRFGLAAFRPGQREVIEVVLGGQDCLCVMPTGGGKSLCYQLPSVAREGVTLVVSPLIALMQDQVRQLQSLGLRATFVNSTLDAAEQNARLDSMAAGEYDLVYVAAERFRSTRFLDAVRAARLQLLAIDEAHCISEWGHDFRPDYARLGRYRAKLGKPPTIALTATATDAVRRDIIEQLDLNDPRIFITGFARPNLFYEVQQPSGQKQKDDALVAFLKQAGKPGIIYASTRKRCEEVAQTIADRTRLRVGVYHAGMLHDDRRRSQEAFMAGGVDVVVATNAFGMGIDKADVRFVIHYNMPGTLEAYYQEAGRAGRDGQPSRCLLLFSTGDKFIQEFFIDSAYPPRQTVKAVYDFLRRIDEDPIELTQQEIKETLGAAGLSNEGVGTCEQLLEKAGVLERLEPRQNMAIARIDSELPTLVDMLPRQATTQRKVLQAIERLIGSRRNEAVYFRPGDLQERTSLDPASLGRALRELKQLPGFDYIPPFRGRAIHMLDRQQPFDALDIDFQALEERKAKELQKLDQVINFARTAQCRQQLILSYFGQDSAEPCGNCDNCSGRRPAAVGMAAVPADDPAIMEAVRKVLSGVARTNARFGKHAVAQMLCGSKSAKITKARLHVLSTYGLLASLKQEEVTCLIDALLTGGLVEQVDSGFQRPVLLLSERGTLVMRGQATLERLMIPPELAQRLKESEGADAPAATPARPPSEPVRPAQAVSPRKGGQSGTPAPREPAAPASAARHRPDDAQGNVASRDRSPIASPTSTPSAAVPNVNDPLAPGRDGHPPHYWTWRLLSSGFTPDECATIRGFDTDVVLDHALRAADGGLAVQCEWFLTAEQQAGILEVVGPENPARIRPLLDRMPRGIRYGHVQWYLKCRATGEAAS
ncbi:MAG: RecQ family ATP-dependent DNA helicase [Pirellulales bacterium]